MLHLLYVVSETSGMFFLFEKCMWTPAEVGISDIILCKNFEIYLFKLHKILHKHHLLSRQSSHSLLVSLLSA